MKTPTRTDIASALRYWEVAYSPPKTNGPRSPQEKTAHERTETQRNHTPPRDRTKGFADKSLVNPLEYLATRFHLRVMGNEAVFLCPFHDDHTPSLCFNLKERVFYCHGCNESGDVITFHMKLSGLPFKTACKDLGCWVEVAR
jgi:hypothetical protein